MSVVTTKVDVLSELKMAYDRGMLNKYEYWDLRFKITLPEFIEKRTAICKELGLLAHYLGEFSVGACYKTMMKGGDITRYKTEAIVNKKERETEFRHSALNARMSNYLSSYKG